MAFLIKYRWCCPNLSLYLQPSYLYLDVYLNDISSSACSPAFCPALLVNLLHPHPSPSHLIATPSFQLLRPTISMATVLIGVSIILIWIAVRASLHLFPVQSIFKIAARGSPLKLKSCHSVYENLLIVLNFPKVLQDLPTYLNSASLNSPHITLFYSTPAYWLHGSSSDMPSMLHLTHCTVPSLSWNASSPNSHVTYSHISSNLCSDVTIPVRRTVTPVYITNSLYSNTTPLCPVLLALFP